MRVCAFDSGPPLYVERLFLTAVCRFCSLLVIRKSILERKRTRMHVPLLNIGLVAAFRCSIAVFAYPWRLSAFDCRVCCDYQLVSLPPFAVCCDYHFVSAFRFLIAMCLRIRSGFALLFAVCLRMCSGFPLLIAV